MADIAPDPVAVRRQVGASVPAHRDPTLAEIPVSVLAPSIAGGTDEIQPDIQGERVLGRPREPAVDVDRPFHAQLRKAGG